jgi:predicted lipoprotein
MRYRTSIAVASLALLLALPGCKLVKNEDLAKAKAENGGDAGQAAFDSDKMARDMWGPKIVPYLEAKAGPFADVRSLITESPDDAGKRFGYREKPEGMPWTIATRLDGRIVAVNTASRAATVDVDVDGDGVADAVVQIGPVIRGTALRDGLDFVSFNAFTNQIDYAKFAKSLNTLMAETTLAKLPREDLTGRHIWVVGVFALEKPGDKPLVTPAVATLGDKS